MTSLLLTRPLEASLRFIDGLSPDIRDRLNPIVSPLLEIVPLDQPVDFHGVGGLVVTSANGVTAAIQLNAPRDIPVYCVGAETTRAAQRAGWTAELMGQNADELVSALPGYGPRKPLLHLSGSHRRGRIAERLTAAGCPTQEKAVYDQRLLSFNDQALAVLNREAPVLVPLFSPRTARQFADLYDGRASLFLMALSKAVAEPLRSLNYRDLSVCDHPDAAAMTATVEKMAVVAWRVEGDEAAH